MKSLFKNFKGDVFGGLTAGIVALPLALAFGLQSGLGASAGLYGAIFIGFFAALFGGTATQISGPTAPMTAVSMVIITGIVQLNEGSVEKALPTILLVFFLAGLFQVGFGLIKGGSLIRYIPYPVVSGFMTGIGVIILITQLLPLAGYAPAEDSTLVNTFKAQAEEVWLEKILKDEAKEGLLVLEDFRETARRAEQISQEEVIQEARTLVQRDSSGVVGALKYLPGALNNIRWIEFFLALATICIIYGFKKITRAVPSTLVALLLISGIAAWGGLSVRTIGQIPSGFPKLHLDIFSGFSWSQFSPYIFMAISLALLGAIDSLLTSVVADNMTKTKHNSNRELVGQGIGNSIAALFGGIPGAGATIRTVVNIQSGGKTNLSGMMAALILLLTLLVLGPLASTIPAAALAGILITVGIGVIDYKGIRALPKMPRTDAVVLLLVMVLTVFWDLLYAVAIGLVISSLMFMKKMASVTATQSRVEPLTVENSWVDEAGLPQQFKEEVFIKHLDGPLFFGFTTHFQQLAAQIPKTASIAVIRMDKVPYMDQSGLNAIEDVFVDLAKADIKILLVGLQKQPNYLMQTIDIIPNLVPEGQVFEDFEKCLSWIINYFKENHIV